jgi:hypothetical protein
MQFGSLVISLPCYHKGGQLIVRHAKHSMTFDWGKDAKEFTKPAVHWAAFYSDCEHEVLEVTGGYRITLTYNLYHSPGVGNLAGYSIPMNTQSLPLFQYVRAALNEHGFMTDGRLLRQNVLSYLVTNLYRGSSWNFLPTCICSHTRRRRKGSTCSP